MAKLTAPEFLSKRTTERMEKLGLNKTQVQIRSGLGLMTVRRVIEGKADLRLSTLAKLAEALEAKPSEMVP